MYYTVVISLNLGQLAQYDDGLTVLATYLLDRADSLMEWMSDIGKLTVSAREWLLGPVGVAVDTMPVTRASPSDLNRTPVGNE